VEHGAALLAPLMGIDLPPLLVGTVGGAVLLIVLGLYGMVTRRDPVEARLGQGGATVAGGDSGNTLRVESRERLKSIDRFLAPADRTRRSQVRLRMQQAGYRGDSVIRIYYLSRAVSSRLGVSTNQRISLRIISGLVTDSDHTQARGFPLRA
jgi:pilus assembly protein TadC